MSSSPQRPGPIRIAVIGLGWVALHRHLPQIGRNPDFQLVGVIDRRVDAARSVAGRYKRCHWASSESLDDIVWLDEVDAVAITAAPAAHYALAMAALARGLHVLTEKPFAMTPEEGREIAAAARDAGRIVGIVHNFQFSRSMQALLRDHATGRLGPIRSVTGSQFSSPGRRLPEWYETLPLGLFYDESPHLLYLLDRLAGNPLAVARCEIIASTTGLRTPAQVNVTLFAEGDPRPFSLHCNFESPVSEWHLLVCGERALGIVDLFRDIYVRIPNDGAHSAWPVLRTSLCATWDHWRQVTVRGLEHLAGGLSYGNAEVYRRFADAVLRDPRRIAPIDAERAVRTLELQHAIIRFGGAASR